VAYFPSGEWITFRAARPLAGPFARIDRADELLQQLDEEFRAFLQSSPYDVEEIPDSDKQTRTFVLRSLHDVPARARVIAGEAAHHLRSALDLLAFQLLVQEGVSDPSRLRDCAFPIITNRDLANPTDKKKHDESLKSRIGGISPKAYCRIVALQPCSTNGEWSHLAQVQALDNTDKHRLLLAAASSMDLHNFAHVDETGKATVYPQAYVPLQVGQMIKLAPATSRMRLPSLAHEVTFMEPGPVFGKPIVHILQNLSRMTRQTVQAFADCF
jgi:hypothetical protein